MKKILLIFLIGFALKVNAQYFKNFYEPTKMNSGLVTVSSGDGHLMAGIMDNANYFALVRTDKSGVFSGMNNFRKQYGVTYNNHTATITGVEAVEYDDGLGYGVLGSFSTNYSENGLFFAKVDLSGNITATHYLGAGTDEIVINAACVSHQRTRHMFGTGNLSTTANKRYFYIEIDSTGSYVNGFIMNAQQGYSPVEDFGPCPYPDDIRCYGIVESQFADPTTGEYYVIVVGKYLGGQYSTLTSKYNGFYMPVRPSQGFGAPFRIELNFPGYGDVNDEWFTGVTSLSDGYLISGLAQNSGNSEFNGWLTQLRGNSNPASAVVWSKIYVSPNNSGAQYQSELYDVKERIGQSQYYAIGKDHAFNSNTDLSEILLVTNTSGGVVSGTFYDAGSQNELNPINIDLDYSTPGDGVALYSSQDAVLNPPTDMKIRKVQFNGNYDCDYNTYTPTDVDVAFNAAFSYGYGAAWSEGNITVSYSDEFDYDVACSSQRPASPSFPTGTFNPIRSENILCNVYPNPANSNQEINIDLSPLKTGDVDISLYNIVGKEIYHLKVDLLKSGKSITLSGSELNLSAGVYMLKLKSNNFSQNMPLVVK